MRGYRIASGLLFIIINLSSAAQDMPYSPSRKITGMEIDWSTHQRHAQGSDNFQLTWADDNNQYGIWGDGDGFAGPIAASTAGPSPACLQKAYKRLEKNVLLW